MDHTLVKVTNLLSRSFFLLLKSGDVLLLVVNLLLEHSNLMFALVSLILDLSMQNAGHFELMLVHKLASRLLDFVLTALCFLHKLLQHTFHLLDLLSQMIVTLAENELLLFVEVDLSSSLPSLLDELCSQLILEEFHALLIQLSLLGSKLV